ncbi:5-formyltetrahydrofolate cyclo-ligase [Aurantiacibacter aquimixticola]|uniref:5-formyltetrahydrofolate cyclo-ligase n=1 Tax=Aurantiacibacter aquimixticola TaxID=1958945 RepID=UPI001F5BADFE|nr:5-formyltetrahydrofolate cyclo-ligase [Aurantiacibacter aquimixticola]
MTDISSEKAALRKRLRDVRRENVAALPPQVSALVFRRPPASVLEMIPSDAVIGLYRHLHSEAPAAGYARFFAEQGHTIALPRVGEDRTMAFHVHTDPFGESDLEEKPPGVLQPFADARIVSPDVLIVPLIGFTDRGERLGQGGGFYDRWLADHPETLAIGLAWDVQKVDALPTEAHDRKMSAIITPTRIYGPFA